MVETYTSYRMNPLPALNINSNALLRENYRHHGGILYPSIHPLSADKPQEAPGSSVSLGYNLLYRPDVTLLDGRKSTNRYLGVYKSPTGFQKPLIVPTAGGDGLGLDRQVLTNDKSDVGLDGAGSFLRLPRTSPYADATMYPFLDMAYKASFLSQPSPFIHQQLAYQSLCAIGAGISTSGEDRLFYLPHYAPSPISSSLGTPIKMPTVPPVPAVVSPLPHCQDKAFQSLLPQARQENPAFNTSPQTNQSQPQTVSQPEQQHGNSSGIKCNQSFSSKNTISSSSCGSTYVPVESSANNAALQSTPVTHSPCLAPPPTTLCNTTTDLHKSLHRSDSSLSSSLKLSQPYNVCSPIQSGSNKTKSNSDLCTAEKCTSPDRAVPKKPVKNQRENPLDLSAKEFEGFLNGFPSKQDAFAKLGYLSPASYGLPTSQDQRLKEGVSVTSRTLDCPEVISTMPSTWVLCPSPAVNSDRGSQNMKNKSIDDILHHPHSQSSPGSTALQVDSDPSTASGEKPSASSPCLKPRVPSTDQEKVHPNSKGQIVTCPVKQSRLSFNPEAQETHSLVEAGNSSSKIYGESYLPPGLGYTNRYIPYSVAENMTLQRMAIPGKGPLYPHPVLLGGSGFYPPHIAPKIDNTYGVYPDQDDFMTYKNSHGITFPPVSSEPRLDRLETQDKTQNPDSRWNQDMPDADIPENNDNEKDKFTSQASKASGKSNRPTCTRNDVVFIDLLCDEADDDVSTKRQNSSKHNSNDGSHIQEREPLPPKALSPNWAAEQRHYLVLQPSQPHPQPQHHNSSSYCNLSQEIQEEILEKEEPFQDIPEEESMCCARTSLHQFSRSCKVKSFGVGRDLERAVASKGNDVIDEMNSSTEAKAETLANRNVNPEKNLSRKGSLLGHFSSCSIGCSNSNNIKEAVCVKAACHSDNLVRISKGSRKVSPQVVACRSFDCRDQLFANTNQRSTTCNNKEVNSSNFVNSNVMSPCCINLSVKASTFTNPTHENNNAVTPGCKSINPKLTNCENRNEMCPIHGDINLRTPACVKDCLSCPNCECNLSKGQTLGNNCVNTNVQTNGYYFHHGPTCNVTETPNSSLIINHCGDVKEDIQQSIDPMSDDDEDASCSKMQCSGLTKRIANSSGYVGDRLKCVTTEIYSDSSKLSREQKALQRAMVRFSELELKEKGGGTGEKEEGEMEWVERGRGQEEEGENNVEEEGRKKEGAGWKHSQQSEGRQGGGRSPSATRAVRGVQTSCPQKEESFISQPQQQSFLSTAKDLFQGNTALPTFAPSLKADHEVSNLNKQINQRRIFSLEPFHQSSIISSRLKRAREKDDRTGIPNKKTQIRNNSTPDDVKKLKVCIELNGLQLSKPHLLSDSNQWLCPAQRSVEVNGRMDVPVVKQRSEVNNGLCDSMFMRRDSARVLHVVPPSSPTNLPRQMCGSSLSAVTFSRLQDKHQRLRESRRVNSLPHPLPPSSSSSPDLHPFHHCQDDDYLNKPRGKRPFKTKHTRVERAREGEEDRDGGEKDNKEEMSGKFSQSRLPSQPPPSPPHTRVSRPVPPEVRRLIVNKNVGETLLQRAARLGYEEVVLYCLEQRMCEVNHRDNAGYSALHEACAHGWLGIISHLLENGADVNCSAQDGTRPLHDAVENDHVEAVRLLLACGADLTLTSYSGRGPIDMTHSATMETFLEDYLADLQKRSEGDPGIYWEFYGGSVCEPSIAKGVYNILADPPGPEEEENGEENEDMEHRARREVFEFELSDRPLLPCYNIQVSLSRGPRNWLLLCDVLGRLRMTSRSFRRLFPQLNIQSIPEDEFYRQASLSQLLTGPNKQQLVSFRPDVRDPLELVEATPELAGMLGSSLEFVDNCWDQSEASPPPKPPLLPSQRPPPHCVPQPQRQGATEPGTKADKLFKKSGQCHGLKKQGYSRPAAQMETKLNATIGVLEHQGLKKVGSTSTTSKEEALFSNKQCQGCETIKNDAAWQRNLGNVRVHIRDLGNKVGGGTIRGDLKDVQRKVAEKSPGVKTRA